MAYNATADIEEYSAKLRSRIDYLDNTSMNAVGELSELNDNTESFSVSTKKELFEMKNDLEEVNNTLRTSVIDILKLIDQFKNSLDVSKFKALNQRIDSFKGETYITREEFKRWIKEDLS